ncbi:MAG: osmotically inducible protein OsmC [Gammaproteobacteria bacterium]|nr:osmotically inducible protein OsmC [Gammaproteobacteria bacterium]
MKESLVVSFPGGKKVDVDIGNFNINTDQSPEHGGDGSAPEPFAMFLASLASCAGIFALGFCQSRKLSTEGLALYLDWENEDKPPFAAKAGFRLVLPTDFPEKYHASIIRAVEQCKVKHYIHNPPEFSIELS